jgi:hypothetical protein
MKKFAIVVSTVAMLVTVACAGDATNTSSGSWAVAYGTGMANASRMALSALYEGKTNDAVQILEANMDHAVCQMDRLLNRETNYTQVLTSALTSIAAYRRTHKRPKVTLADSEAEQDLLDEVAQQAQHILENYREHEVLQGVRGISPQTPSGPRGQPQK